MSSPSRGLSAGQNPSWTLNFWNRVHRYRCLVQKFWWILVLTLSLCLFAACWYQISRPVTYSSSATLTVNPELIQVSLGDSKQGEMRFGPEDTMGLEIPVVQSGAVRQLAQNALQVKYPEMLASPVKLNVSRDNAILTVTAIGSNAEYTQRYLKATVDAYFENRRNRRNEPAEKTLNSVRNEIAGLKETLKKDDDEINDYQRSKRVVFDKDDANGANAALTAARQKLEVLKDKENQLRLMTPEQALRGGQAPAPRAVGGGAGGAEAGSAAEGDYRQAMAQLATLRAQREDFSRDLRPKHPKIITLSTAIASQEKLIESLQTMSVKGLQGQLRQVESLIVTATAELKEAEAKAYDANLMRSEFDKLVEKKNRDLAHYGELQTKLAQTVSNGNFAVDPIYVMDPPSVALSVPSSWAKILVVAIVAGLASGAGILVLIDRMDDRMNSVNDFQLHFSEAVLGQIPRDAEVREGDTELLKPDDERHQLVESYRNLRSTLLFMPLEGERPKTLLITSAVPNEGKSTTSCNLALMMAAAGMKTLLIDADLRRGAIHSKFGVSRDPGLTDVLGHNVNWKIAIRQTKMENLHILPRGRNVPQPSEYLLNKNTDRLLQELYPLYDYIIIDSSPVLAADDTASLAPKIDATLFVVRMGFTSAKMTRKSLEILYGRQANIPGLILNQVDTSSPEFVYYQYSEYYHTAKDEDDGGNSSDKAAGAAEPAKPVEPAVKA